MSNVPARRARRQDTDPPAPLPALDLNDRDAARRWLAELTVAIEDATSVTADMLAPLRERRLGPAQARHLHDDATATLRDLLDACERGLTAGSRGAP